jgi:23S rRNA pseudouridine1911/1915/1917 synthase
MIEQIDDINYPPLVENKYEFTISKGQSRERLDQFLTHSIHNATRNKVQNAIEGGMVLVNNQKKKVSYKISPNDYISCIVMQMPPMELIPENIPLNFVYEDDYLLVVNKPADMCVHPGVGNRYGTLVNALLFHFGFRNKVDYLLDYDNDDANKLDDMADINSNIAFNGLYGFDENEIRPGLVHRIDKDTTGLLVVAKNPTTHTFLANQFANKTTEREYYAIVWGTPKLDKGSIEGNIGRSSRDRTSFAILDYGGKPAITDYEVVERFSYTALMKFKLRTGRTHQIRVHSGSIGHKLFGDVRYEGNKILFGNENPQWRKIAQKYIGIGRQMLHAKTLGFIHPVTKEKMLFDSELPDDMSNLIKILRDN